jgi:hypothetical protein
MKILTIKDTSLEKIKLSNPDYSKNTMYVEIFNDGNPLYVQTPKMLTSCLSSESEFISFMFDPSSENVRKYYKLFKCIEDKICELISENSLDWFPECLDTENIKNNLFKTSLKVPDTLEHFIKMNATLPKIKNEFDFEIYNQRKTKVDKVCIKPDTPTIALLTASELIITSSCSYVIWEVAQLQIYQQQDKITAFSIRKEEEILQKLHIGISKKEIAIENVKPLEENLPETPQNTESFEPEISQTEIVKETPVKPPEPEISQPEIIKETHVDPLEPEIVPKEKSKKKKKKDYKLSVNLVDDDNRSVVSMAPTIVNYISDDDF